MWRIILADWRRLLLLEAGNLSVFLIIFILLARDFARCGVPTECYDQARLTTYLFVSLAYGHGFLVLWAQMEGTGIYLRQRLVDTLPYSCRELNRLRLLTGAFLLAVGLPHWIPVVVLWRRFDVPLSPWVALSTILLAALFWLVSMRNLFPRVLLPVPVPLLLIPGSERVSAPFLALIAEPWTAAVLAAAVFLFAWRIMDRPPPRWATRGTQRRKFAWFA